VASKHFLKTRVAVGGRSAQVPLRAAGSAVRPRGGEVLPVFLARWLHGESGNRKPRSRREKPVRHGAAVELRWPTDRDRKSTSLPRPLLLITPGAQVAPVPR
jgi:hypothetical protein